MSDTINPDIKKEVRRDKILERMGVLSSTFRTMKQLSHIDGIEKAEINHAKVLQIVRSHFYDIYRIKLFHGITTKTTLEKVAAYTTKWIVRLKPIYFSGIPDADIKREMMYLNEIFAIQVSLTLAKIPISSVSHILLNKLIYSLHYRPVDENGLMLFYESLILSNEKYEAALRCFTEQSSDK